ncbi:tetratricopeptide repeat protein [Klenkia taihuensis]|uniref:Tetratricopeptide repeat-containing protein n=1 Tax=Klenkia taihuensis TaxID=1225127 RepID=A0A1I1UAU1_9ACTN|nr:tetratricopeptide repeat protein [Klenkia taihuensis]GHE06780.1 hypothetical protein GCM10011381_00020 [Klenkia taihuensis]SFD67857.1 hypothetical protein SAMN05661030_3993 [Klenkia taihuensis]
MGPPIPGWADPKQLDGSVRRALKGLESRNAGVVGQHLAAAGGLLEDDPAAALAHAQAARGRASRIAVVREAVGVAAYHAGDFAEAARELRAYRRMSGDESYRAVLADCERALGRPDAALKLVTEALAAGPDEEETVELRLVEAGSRQDLGELPAAALVLEAALGGRPDPAGLRNGDTGQLRLATAYADLLETRGDVALAQQWFEAIMEADPDDETGVAARYDDVDDDADDLDDLDDTDDFGDGLADDGTDVDAADEEPEDGDVADGDVADGDVADGDVADEDADDEGVTADDELLAEGDGDADLAEYDPDEQDVEEEVAELLGEIPVPGFSDPQTTDVAVQPQRGPLPDRSEMFAAPGERGEEHEPPTS